MNLDMNCYPFVMADLCRARVVWTGGAGLPGVNTFYFPPSSLSAHALLADFFDAHDAVIPSTVTVTIDNTGDIIDDETGTLVGTWTQGTPYTGTGIADPEHAAGVGLRYRWLTDSIVGGRRLAGATFMAPLSAALFSADGTVDDSNLTTLRGYANTFASAELFAVWHRPTTPGGSDGSHGIISSFQVPDRVTSLRSRRY